MNATPATAVPPGTPETRSARPNYLNAEYGMQVLAADPDHKRIAMLYLISVTAFFVLGGMFAMLIRLELLTPGGDLMQPDTYNRLFTMHGIMMVFFFLIPAIPAVLGNFLLPLMIGAKDLAFPRLNLVSWYIYILGGVVHPLGDRRTAASTPAGRSTRPYSTAYSNSYVIVDRHRDLHHRLLVDPHRPQLHRHHPPHAGAGPDLVPAAAVRLGALRDQPDHQSWARR